MVLYRNFNMWWNGPWFFCIKILCCGTLLFKIYVNFCYCCIQINSHSTFPNSHGTNDICWTRAFLSLSLRGSYVVVLRNRLRWRICTTITRMRGKDKRSIKELSQYRCNYRVLHFSSWKKFNLWGPTI